MYHSFRRRLRPVECFKALSATPLLISIQFGNLSLSPRFFEWFRQLVNDLLKILKYNVAP